MRKEISWIRVPKRKMLAECSLDPMKLALALASGRASAVFRELLIRITISKQKLILRIYCATSSSNSSRSVLYCTRVLEYLNTPLPPLDGALLSKIYIKNAMRREDAV